MWRDPRFMVGVGTGLVAVSLLGMIFSFAYSGNNVTDIVREGKARGYEVLTKAEFDRQLATAKQQAVAAQAKDKATKDAPVYFYIASGMNLSDVGALLSGVSIIDDANSFVDAAQQEKAEGKIVAGLHWLPRHSDVKVVLQTITQVQSQASQ